MTRSRRGAIVAAFAAATLVVGGAAAWLLVIPNVPILPGVQGCRYIQAAPKLRGCIADRTTNMIQEEELRTALTSVKRLAAKEPRANAVCHDAMHTVADGAKFASREDFAVASRIGGSCADGYAHGSVARTLQSGSDKDLRATIAYCIGVASKDRSNCIHGIGHGIYRSRKTKGFDVCMRSDVDMTKDDSQQCLAGAFMEEFITHPPRGTSAKDFTKRCDREPIVIATACYPYVPSNAIRAGLDAGSVGDVCTSIDRLQGLRSCADGLGQFLTPGVQPDCTALKGTVYEYCMRGFLAVWLATRAQLTVLGTAKECASKRTPDPRGCARALGSNLDHPDLTTKRRGEGCGYFSDLPLRKECEQARKLATDDAPRTQP